MGALFACAVVAPSRDTISSPEGLSTVCVHCSSSESRDYDFSGSCVQFVCAVVAPSQETSFAGCFCTDCVRCSISE